MKKKDSLDIIELILIAVMIGSIVLLASSSIRAEAWEFEQLHQPNTCETVATFGYMVQRARNSAGIPKEEAKENIQRWSEPNDRYLAFAIEVAYNHSEGVPAEKVYENLMKRCYTV